MSVDHSNINSWIRLWSLVFFCQRKKDFLDDRDSSMNLISDCLQIWNFPEDQSRRVWAQLLSRQTRLTVKVVQSRVQLQTWTWMKTMQHKWHKYNKYIWASSWFNSCQDYMLSIRAGRAPLKLLKLTVWLCKLPNIY